MFSLANHEAEKISADPVLKANIELLKLYNAYHGKRSVHASFSLKGSIKDIPYSEAKKRLAELNGELSELDTDE